MTALEKNLTVSEFRKFGEPEQGHGATFGF
jgi:hypothetical protein